MSAFETVLMAHAPPDVIRDYLRDGLPSLATALSDVDHIDLLDRTENDDGVRVTHRWISAQAIPGFLQDRLGVDSISWLDAAFWPKDEFCCTWSVQPNILPGEICCEGSTVLEPAMGGRGARVTFRGALNIAPGALRRVAGAFEKPAIALVESIATVLIPRNFRAVLEAIKASAR
jgi:hypothetical protein